MEKLLAWHGREDLKTEVVARMREHREHDEIVQGTYQEIDPEAASGYRGCAIGCTLPKYDTDPDEGWHAEVQRLYGIPAGVAHLIDAIFEGLPADGAHAEFALASIEAVPVGVDLSLVSSHLMLDLLAHPEHGVWRHTAEGSDQRAVVEAVAGLYRRRLAGDEPSGQAWDAAGAAARDAAGAAAWDAAGDAAGAAAGAAAWDAAGAAAWDAEWRWLAGRLLHHLSTTPIPALT